MKITFTVDVTLVVPDTLPDGSPVDEDNSLGDFLLMFMAPTINGGKLEAYTTTDVEVHK